MTTTPPPSGLTRLENAARQAANAFYNIAQFDRPLTDRERQSCKEVREALDSALRRISAAPDPVEAEAKAEPAATTIDDLAGAKVGAYYEDIESALRRIFKRYSYVDDTQLSEVMAEIFGGQSPAVQAPQ